MKCNSTLTTLGIRHDYDNGIAKCNGIETLTGHLAKNGTLKELSFEFSYIGDKGVRELSKIASTNTSLTALDLSVVNFKDCTSVVLFLANNRLVRLKLIHNNIKEDGIQLVAQALKLNTSLTNLYLGNLHISLQDIKILSDALKHNTTLKKLNLIPNSIKDRTNMPLLDNRIIL